MAGEFLKRNVSPHKDSVNKSARCAFLLSWHLLVHYFLCKSSTVRSGGLSLPFHSKIRNFIFLYNVAALPVIEF